ncbi:hypothetical protein Q5O24_06670 [Eubacteriaceae bacterium ES3]|nr:hypothetical protein Q5O24_06670 [Eubacteriaceae bacterium ES3]
MLDFVLRVVLYFARNINFFKAGVSGNQFNMNILNLIFDQHRQKEVNFQIFEQIAVVQN